MSQPFEYWTKITAESNPQRPAGVAVSAIIFLALALTAISLAALLWLQLLPLSYGAYLLPNGFEQAGPIALLIYAGLTVFVALGLWRGINWARRLAVFLAVAGIVFVIPAISSAVVDGRPLTIAREGLQIIVRVAMVYYLSQEPVREWFLTSRGRS